MTAPVRGSRPRTLRRRGGGRTHRVPACTTAACAADAPVVAPAPAQHPVSTSAPSTHCRSNPSSGVSRWGPPDRPRAAPGRWKRSNRSNRSSHRSRPEAKQPQSQGPQSQEPGSAPARDAGRKGRTRVPSWDDVVFGARAPRDRRPESGGRRDRANVEVEGQDVGIAGGCTRGVRVHPPHVVPPTGTSYSTRPVVARGGVADDHLLPSTTMTPPMIRALWVALRPHQHSASTWSTCTRSASSMSRLLPGKSWVRKSAVIPKAWTSMSSSSTMRASGRSARADRTAPRRR